MGDLKGLAEIADHLIYEALALLLPGAALLLGVVAAAVPEAWPNVLTFATAHPWLAAGASYASGYLVQSTSRPMCNVTRWLLTRPLRLLVYATRPLGGGKRVAGWWQKTIAWLRSGPEPQASVHADLRKIERDRWVERLGLAKGVELRDQDVLNLSFSTLGDERRRLGRFRAITSCCRAFAALSALALWGLGGAVIGPWPLTAVGAVAIGVLVVVFFAFSERADMYHRLWSDIVTVQFLCAPTPEGPSIVSHTAVGPQPHGNSPPQTANHAIPSSPPAPFPSATAISARAPRAREHEE